MATPPPRKVFPLLRLAAELRNQIYEYALIEETIPIHAKSAKPKDILSEPGVLSVGRQIRSEALPIFYSENTFTVRSGYEPVQFLQRLPQYKLRHLRTLRIAADSFWLKQLYLDGHTARMTLMEERFGPMGLRSGVYQLPFEVGQGTGVGDELDY